METLRALYRRHIRIIPGVKSYVLATIFIFLFGLAITLVTWYADRDRMDEQRQTKLNQQAEAVNDSISNRLNIYEQILRGGNGLMNASDTVSTQEWNRFIGQYDLQYSYPGINAVGFVESVKANEVQAYTEKMKSNGFADFKIVPEGTRSEYAPVTYVSTLLGNSNSAIGYDVMTESHRAASIAKARDTADVSISDKLTLISDARNGNHSTPGFIMYVATYGGESKPKSVEERRKNVKGYVFAGFKADNFFKKIIENTEMNSYKAISVYDGSDTNPESLLYKTANFNDYSDEDTSRKFQKDFFGRTWTMQYAGPITNKTQENQRSTLILFGGIILSTAISGFLFLVMFTRARDIVYVKQREAQQAKDDLLSLASHQLRTPATAVKQYLGMVLEGYIGEIPDKQQPILQKAYASNERQLEIINQILYVAKADAGRLSISPSKFDINMLVNEIALDLEDTLQERGQEIKIETTGRKKLYIVADEASLRMVIENLVSNASKYSYSGGVINIKTSTENDKILIAVSDHGVGINPDDHDKLFKKFSRIDNDLSLQVGGSGIGLYIDKVLVELHGGTIRVDSKQGEGSTFTVCLPKKVASNLTDDSNKGELK